MQKLTGKLRPARADWRQRARTAGPSRGTCFAGAGRLSYVPAKAVGSFVPGLTQKAFEKYGFSTATLLTDWTVIVGKDLARATVPERLKWPHLPNAVDGPSTETNARPGATLIVRVDPSMALDVEYQSAQMIERINGYFGYKAVANLRLLQAPVAEAPVARKQAGTTPRATRETAPSGHADALTRALARLAEAVMASGLPAPRTS
jgi:hypothetical protein